MALPPWGDLDFELSKTSSDLEDGGRHLSSQMRALLDRDPSIDPTGLRMMELKTKTRSKSARTYHLLGGFRTTDGSAALGLQAAKGKAEQLGQRYTPVWYQVQGFNEGRPEFTSRGARAIGAEKIQGAYNYNSTEWTSGDHCPFSGVNSNQHDGNVSILRKEVGRFAYNQRLVELFFRHNPGLVRATVDAWVEIEDAEFQPERKTPTPDASGPYEKNAEEEKDPRRKAFDQLYPQFTDSKWVEIWSAFNHDASVFDIWKPEVAWCIGEAFLKTGTYTLYLNSANR